MHANFRTVWALCCLLLFPFGANSADEGKQRSVREQNLANLLPPSEVTWLTDENGEFLGLYREYIAKAHRGIIILVPDRGQAVNNYDYIEPMRHQLNRVGWSTLAIMPPIASSTEKEQEVTYTKQLIARVNSAVEWAKQKHSTSVLLIQGRQIGYLVEAQAKQFLQPISAFVLVNVQPAFRQVDKELSERFPDNEDLLAAQLTALTLPILDLNQTDRSENKQRLITRAALANKAQHPNYRQVEFLARENYQPATKLIYGWLASLGFK